jgi:hypothetical protein
MKIYSVLYWSIDNIAIVASFKDYDKACGYIKDIFNANAKYYKHKEDDFSCIANDEWFSKYYYNIEENELKD